MFYLFCVRAKALESCGRNGPNPSHIIIRIAFESYFKRVIDHLKQLHNTKINNRSQIRPINTPIHTHPSFPRQRSLTANLRLSDVGSAFIKTEAASTKVHQVFLKQHEHRKEESASPERNRVKASAVFGRRRRRRPHVGIRMARVVDWVGFWMGAKVVGKYRGRSFGNWALFCANSLCLWSWDAICCVGLVREISVLGLIICRCETFAKVRFITEVV